MKKPVTVVKTASIWARAGFALLASFCVLIICTKDSFLYPMNDWVDVNCFFTVGRGIKHGLVPYLDLYEQKGPLLYFVYALAALISENSFLGVFIVEVCLYATFLYLGGRMAELLSDTKSAYWITVTVLSVTISLSPAFSHGGSAEQLFLPVFALTLYTVLKAMHGGKPFTRFQAALLGALAAAALWTKYTFCGLFAGLMLAILAWYLVRKMYKRIPELILFTALGALAVSAAVLVWYMIRGALPALWQVYFVDNLTQYSKNIRSGNYDPPLLNLFNNLSWSIPAMLGLIWLPFGARKNRFMAWAAAAGAIALFAFTYMSGRKYPYYALVLSTFAPLGYAAVFALLPKKLKTKPRFDLVSAVLAMALILASPLLTYNLSQNSYMLSVKKEEMPQYRFAEIIRQSEDKTLLNYGFLDGGFYFASGSLPVTRYFCTLNNNLDEMTSALRSYVSEGKTAFLVVRTIEMPPRENAAAEKSTSGDASKKPAGADQVKVPDENDPYELIDECSMMFEGLNCKYSLYRRIPGQ